MRRASSFGAHVVFNVNRKSSWRVFPGGIAITRALGARPLKTRKPPLIVAQPDLAKRTPVSYTHLTLPTILLV